MTPVARRGATARAVVDAVHAEPGLTLTELARRLAVDASTVDYHAHRLASTGLVVVVRTGRVRLYPPGQVAIVPPGMYRRAFDAILQKPGAGPSEVAQLLGIGVSDAAHRLHWLSETGVLRRQPWGCRVRYWAARVPA